MPVISFLLIKDLQLKAEVTGTSLPPLVTPLSALPNILPSL